MLKTFSGRNASQNESELRAFISLLKEKGVTSYLEIGARHGDTFHEVMLSLPVGSYGLAVDLPGALWGKKSSADFLQAAAADLRSKGYVIDVIIGDSTASPIIRRVKGKGPFDAALIDGDHTLSGVTKDWENYGDCAELVAFHDIVGEGQKEKVHNHRVEVPKFWAGLKKKVSDYREFIAPGSLMGIGVIELRE